MQEQEILYPVRGPRGRAGGRIHTECAARGGYSAGNRAAGYAGSSQTDGRGRGSARGGHGCLRGKQNVRRTVSARAARRRRRCRRMLARCAVSLGILLLAGGVFYASFRLAARLPAAGGQAAAAAACGTAEAGAADTTAEKLAWIRSHSGLYPADEADKAEGNEGLIDFLYGWQNGTIPADGEISFTQQELDADVPLLQQWDPRWGASPYGSSVIGITGCGPTCLSMVVLGLTGNTEATPRALAEYATRNGYYRRGSGTRWTVFPAAAQAWGVQCSELPLSESAMRKALEHGGVLICSMGPGHFTATGHFIVIAGAQDGGFCVNDPNSTANSAALWPYDTLAPEIRAMWVFTPA